LASGDLKGFLDILPPTKSFFHAIVSGQELWTDNEPKLVIIQEKRIHIYLAGKSGNWTFKNRLSKNG